MLLFLLRLSSTHPPQTIDEIRIRPLPYCQQQDGLSVTSQHIVQQFQKEETIIMNRIQQYSDIHNNHKKNLQYN